MDTIAPAAIAAFAVDISVYPLDTVKSRIQAADYKERFPQGKGLYKGLWQGFGPVVLATLPSAALFFTTYEHSKTYLTSSTTPIIGPYVASDPKAMALAHTASSALAELAACLIVTPAETIKQQMQVATATKMREPFTSYSFRSAWQSYWALAGRNLPFTAMQFPLYEYFRAGLARRVGLPERKRATLNRAGHQSEPKNPNDVMIGEGARRRAYQTVHHGSTPAPEYTTTSSQHYTKAGLVSGVSAAAAGTISALVTTPLDLVKTRVMLQSSSQKLISPTTWSIARDIWKREGLPGLMKGGTMRCAFTALGAGIYLGAYESGREWWSQSGKEQLQETADRASEIVEEVKSSR